MNIETFVNQVVKNIINGITSGVNLKNSNIGIYALHIPITFKLMINDLGKVVNEAESSYHTIEFTIDIDLREE
jgi:hypothetical protein